MSGFGRGMRRAAYGVMTCAALLAAAAAAAAPADPWLRPAAVPAPADNAPTAARVALGRALFFDPRLSRDGFFSCASCHNPGLAWTDGLKTALDNNLHPLSRHTPTLVNIAYSPLLMWDGRMPTLEKQVFGPLTSATQMAMPIGALIDRIARIDGYRPMFDAAYPGQGVTADTIGKAIASFERTIVSQPAPFDRWRMGDENAISAEAKHGFDLFNGKADCAKCHSGFNFTDNGFHNIGLGDGDVGRFKFLKLPSMLGAFKTPTLRDVALHPPYMHNGSLATLAAVIDHYDRGGIPGPNLSSDVHPLHLTAQEKADLLAFLQTLTSPRADFPTPPLPPS